jgi:hypothetical protein
MPKSQPLSSTNPSALEAPRCPKCDELGMLLSKIAAGPSDFDYRTFECSNCDRHHTMIVSRDPMTDLRSGWLSGELRPPD